jgi:transposase
MFPTNVFDLLAADHECYLYQDLFEQLDTSSLEANYSPLGQHAYQPKLIVSILIYSYSRGVFSSREIERRCNEDLSFMFIAGMNCPNFRVLSDFRKNNAEFFHGCFKQTVELAMELRLASLGHISLDGSKFQANSSKHKAMSYQRLKEKEQDLTTEIDALIEQAARCDTEEDRAYQERTGYELPEDLAFKKTRLAKITAAKTALEAREETLKPGRPIEDKKQISFADTDARIMGKHGDFDYQYNAQISVDSDTQIIVGQHVSCNANDKQELAPALQEIQATTGRLPEQLSADNGYQSGSNLQGLEDLSVDGYIATNKGEKTQTVALDESKRKLLKADFSYDEDADTFHCPGGQVLPFKRQDKDGKRVYQGDADTCAACPYHARCCQSKSGAARTITTDDQEPLRKQMNAKMETDAAKAIYKQRKVIVEPVFGHIKNSGFRGFSVRGKAKVAGEFSLICATHNLKKIARSIVRGVVCPKFVTATVKPA